MNFLNAATINASDAAEALVGRPLGSDSIAAAAERAAAIAQPKSDHRGSAAYKRHLVGVFVQRILDAQLNAAVAA